MLLVILDIALLFFLSLARCVLCIQLTFYTYICLQFQITDLSNAWYVNSQIDNYFHSKIVDLSENIVVSYQQVISFSA